MLTNIFCEYFFQSWNEIANTQKIAGWYKVYIRGISEQHEKQKKRPVSISFSSFTWRNLEGYPAQPGLIC
jgi:hypothetical protein